MLNFENPAPDEELENNNPAPPENAELFDARQMEFPRSFHHSAEPTEPVTENVSAPEESKTEPETLRKVTLPQYEEADKKAPVVSSFRQNSTPVPDARKMETARLLAAARNAAGLTQVEVEDRTKVRAFYIEALENGNFDQLPQQVYVLAYLRRLGELYGIKGKDLEELLEPWKDIPCEIPENLPASVYPDPDNPNRKTLHRLEIILYTGGGILAVAIVALVIMLISSYLSGTRKGVNPPFDREVLLELQMKPALTAPAQPKAK